MQQKLKFYIAPLTAKAQKSSDIFTKTKTNIHIFYHKMRPLEFPDALVSECAMVPRCDGSARMFNLEVGYTFATL